MLYTVGYLYKIKILQVIWDRALPLFLLSAVSTYYIYYTIYLLDKRLESCIGIDLDLYSLCVPIFFLLQVLLNNTQQFLGKKYVSLESIIYIRVCCNILFENSAGYIYVYRYVRTQKSHKSFLDGNSIFYFGIMYKRFDWYTTKINEFFI